MINSGQVKKLSKIITNNKQTEAEKCNQIWSEITNNPSCVNELYFSGYTILHLAIVNKLPNVVKLLVEQGANINSQNELGETPLHLAIDTLKGLGIAEYLIKKNCKLDLKDSFNDTPMHTAAKNNSSKIIKRLINLGQSLTLQNNRGETPLHLAAASNSVVSLLLLTRQPEVKKYINLVDVCHETALHKAVRNGNAACIKPLLSIPSLDVGIRNKDKHTAEDLIDLLELDNRQNILKAFEEAKPVKNSSMPEYEEQLFRSPKKLISIRKI